MLEQLTIRREKADIVWEDFEQVQTQIKEESEMTADNEAYRSEFEELYFKTVASCDKIVKSLSSNRNDVNKKLYRITLRCPVFLNLSISDRIKKINALKLCKICLRSHHGEKCKSRNCPKCTCPHNGLLHITSQNRFDKTADPVTSSSNSSIDNRESNKDKDVIQLLTSVSAHASYYEDVQYRGRCYYPPR